MTGVGQALRKARTDRGIELSEVERVTKIREKFLQAMEENRWEALPGPSYARGFLSIYARYLGLDEGALLDEYGKTVEADRPEPIPESVIKPGVLRQNRPTRRGLAIDLKPVAKIAAGLIAVVIIGLVIIGSVGGSSKGGGGEKSKGGKHPVGTVPTTTTSTTTATAPPGQVSVEVRSTAAVWVCLVDDNGDALVNGETLAADQDRGPFDGPGFEVTFGNGSVEMTVDGQPAQVPAVSEPVGYRITTAGVRRLDPSSQPTCL